MQGKQAVAYSSEVLLRCIRAKTPFVSRHLARNGGAHAKARSMQTSRRRHDGPFPHRLTPILRGPARTAAGLRQGFACFTGFLRQGAHLFPFAGEPTGPDPRRGCPPWLDRAILGPASRAADIHSSR